MTKNEENENEFDELHFTDLSLKELISLENAFADYQYAIATETPLSNEFTHLYSPLVIDKAKAMSQEIKEKCWD